MTQESETAAPPLTLGEAMAEYLQHVKPDLRSSYGTYIRKFVEYSGDDSLVSGLSGSRVELYAEQQIKASDPAAPERVAALKAWFQYLKKKEYATANYGVHIRVRRAAGRAAGAQSVRIEQAPIEMTAEGIAELRKQYEELQSRHNDLIKAVEIARSDGDLRENAPYHAAREALSFHQQKMKELENSLGRAIVVEAGASRSTVGSTVKVTNLDRGTQHDYVLVSAREANAGQSRISVESPVGKELLGRREGEEIVVAAPSGEMHFRIDGVRR